MLRKIRITLAILSILMVTALFLDFTGSIHKWLGWIADIQFLPALMALNVGIVVFLLLLTLVFGRVYCSVICPLGIFQDIVSWLSGRRKKKKYRFGYSPAHTRLRLGILILFVIAAIAGIGSFVALMAPYSAYGRIVQNLFSPVYIWFNNILAYFAERAGSYSFYHRDVWIRSIPVFIVALVTFIVIAILAWRGGRTYCNSVCPVGTLLGAISRFSWLRPVINTDKCVNCGLCAKGCKASAINPKEHKIDYTRCVACMDCLEECHTGAISYTSKRTANETSVKGADSLKNDGRRLFMAGAAGAIGSAVVYGARKKVDGGLAIIEDKKLPERHTPLVPAGALSLNHLRQHCTGCQLCVSVCENEVLRPSSDLQSLMQPVMEFDRGYCRPECTACGDVCPAGAIKPVSQIDKSSIQVGHAVWVANNCIVTTDDVECGNCARHCLVGAITMVPSDPSDKDSKKIPAINENCCIGCGACENLCPARPFSAIYVEGHERHKTI